MSEPEKPIVEPTWVEYDPHRLLDDVHPDLAKVVALAWADDGSKQPFRVIQGLRDKATEAALVAKGASTTMHSRHLAGSTGKACAIDVAALTDGHIDWTTSKPGLPPGGPYGVIAAAMKLAGEELSIPIEWGGDWVSFKDYGHFQLPWKDYP